MLRRSISPLARESPNRAKNYNSMFTGMLESHVINKVFWWLLSYPWKFPFIFQLSVSLGWWISAVTRRVSFLSWRQNFWLFSLNCQLHPIAFSVLFIYLFIFNFVYTLHSSFETIKTKTVNANIAGKNSLPEGNFQSCYKIYP